jgi:hypothetical protein
VTFDCFGKLNDFLLASLQKYKLKKISCEKIEGTIGQSSSGQFFTNLLMQLNKEIACKNVNVNR